MRSKRTGFTLIELLVVIAMIAILGAILFPVFAWARADTDQAICLNNTKQTALAFLIYNADYDGFCLTTKLYDYRDGLDGSWWHPVWPYLDPRLLDCPSTDPSPDYWDKGDFDLNINGEWEGAAPCQGLAGYFENSVLGEPANTARVPNPSEVIMFFEKNTGYTSSVWIRACFWGEYMYPGNHNNEAGMHFAFLDGHVKYITTEGAPVYDDHIGTWHGITFCRGYDD